MMLRSTPVGASKRLLTGDALEEDAAEREEIGAGIDVFAFACSGDM
jgi:hypothetical protein